MSGIFRFYDSYFLGLGRGRFAYPADTLKLALLDAAYTPCASFGTRDGLLSYTNGDVVYSAAYTCYFVAKVSGVSALGAPLFDTTLGAETIDGSVTWVSVGLAPPSTHVAWADVSAHEISGAGYTPGGATVSYSHALTGRRAVLSTSDVIWAGSTLTAKYAALRKVGTVDSVVDPLIGYVLLSADGSSLSDDAGDFRVRFGTGDLYALGGW